RTPVPSRFATQRSFAYEKATRVSEMAGCVSMRVSWMSTARAGVASRRMATRAFRMARIYRATTLPTRLKPLSQRLLTLARGLSCDQPFDADVLVELRPMNPFTAANQLPCRSLSRRTVDQARIPRERHRNRAAVTEIHRQRVLCDGYVRCCWDNDFS